MPLKLKGILLGEKIKINDSSTDSMALLLELRQ